MSVNQCENILKTPESYGDEAVLDNLTWYHALPNNEHVQMDLCILLWNIGNLVYRKLLYRKFPNPFSDQQSKFVDFYNEC